MSLSRRFLAYLVALHVLFAAVALWLLRGSVPGCSPSRPCSRCRCWPASACCAGCGAGSSRSRSAARLLAESEFTTRFREVGQPEVDRLIGVYNRMADALREERTRNEEQQGLLARILEVSPSGVVILDFEGVVSFANPAAARLLGPGGTVSELAGRPLLALASPLAARLAALPAGDSVVVAVGGRAPAAAAARQLPGPRLHALVPPARGADRGAAAVGEGRLREAHAHDVARGRKHGGRRTLAARVVSRLRGAPAGARSRDLRARRSAS